MKKFLRFFLGRLLWIGLILLIEIVLIVLFATVLREYLASLHIIWYYVISIGVLIMDLFVMIYIVNSKSNNTYKIAWLFIVGIFSFAGVALYLMFGNKNTTKRMKRKIEPLRKATRMIPTSDRVINELEENIENHDALSIAKYIQKESGSAIYDHTLTTYFPTGNDAWPIMLEKLRLAKHYIFIEYFIIEKGEFWDSILEILIQKVKEGVDVRLMYDDVGSISTLPTSYPKIMENYGIKCVAYNRLKPFVNVKLNNRDHRKILVIDGHIGFTGGINLADEYVGRVIRFGTWKDNAIMLEGRGVYALTMLFLSNWVSIKGGFVELSDSKYLANKYVHLSDISSDGYVQPYGDIPFGDEAIGEEVYLRLINNAKKYIYITTPYLIIDEIMERSLINAAKSGVDVHIITPRIPDKKMVFNVTRSYYENLIDAGIHIHEYLPGFIHEKVFIVDDIHATVGTINLDYRSLYLHMENGVYLFKASTIQKMKEDYETTLAVSEEITLEKYAIIKKHKKVLWALLRIAAPML